MPDKYTAVWTSHTSITDFINCPRGYFLKHVYKDPNTNHKIKVMKPSLALGQAVHDTLESLSVLPVRERFSIPLMERFEQAWQKVRGKQGGFSDEEQEQVYKKRGEEMMLRVYNNPGPLKELSIKIKKDLPYFWLSEEDNIILCGKIDWLQYLPNTDSVHIIDFKTGKEREDESSLQLPIYHLLVDRCQKRAVDKASYWYLEYNDTLTEKELPDLVVAERQILEIARKMKLARQLNKFDCKRGTDGCFRCTDYERVLRGEGTLVGVDEYNYDVYMLPQAGEDEEEESIIL